MKTTLFGAVLVILGLFTTSFALPFLASSLGSNMVLQRDQQARLWGWTSKPGQEVTVFFNNQKFVATSDSTNGYWVVKLPSMKGSFSAYTIVINSTSGDSRVLSNVVFGDVFLCGGQSNMQMTVSSTFNASAEIAQANKYPYIRLFTVGQAKYSFVPLNDLASVEQTWTVASSAAVGGKDWTYFSALCWFFGRNIHLQQNVPVGLVSSNWGGTIVEAWSSPDALAECGLSPANSSSCSTAPNCNGVLWNAMIFPLLNMRLKGTIWYQGESNVFEPNVYECLFPAMITDWRAKFGLSFTDFSFLFVQLAAYTQSVETNFVALPQLRDAQMAALILSHVGMATAIDLGDIDSPYGNIHPRNKQTIAQRLAAVAKTLIYGDARPTYTSGPIIQTAELIASPPDAVIHLLFFHRSTGNGLELRSASCPQGLNPLHCAGLQIQLNNGAWVTPSSVSIFNPHTLEVKLNKMKPGLVPVAVRYAWANWPLCTIYNKHGFPALPFTRSLVTPIDTI
jgi:sialate O-acetylesterase